MEAAVGLILSVAFTMLGACAFGQGEKPPGKTVVAPDNKLILYSGYVHLNVSSSSAACDRLIEDSAFHGDNPSTSIRFRTSAETVAVLLEYAAKNDLPAGHHAYQSVGVCFVDGERRSTFTRLNDAGGRQTLDLSSHSPGKHDYEILMPIADRVTFIGIELSEGARLVSTRHQGMPRYVSYGDSITQGFWASDSSKTYPYLVARGKRWQLVNMGFGSRTATPSDGQIVARQNPDLVTILIGVNDCLGGVSLSSYRENVRGLISNLRKTKAALPIYVITPLNVPGKWKGTEPLDQYRDVLRAVVRESGDAHLHLIEGPDLIPDDFGYFQDGLHPNDAGFALMAQRLKEKLVMR